MNKNFLQDPAVPAVCLHNTVNWQVSELMGGLACELLRKQRVVDRDEQRRTGLSTHACYASVFMQGDEASDFLEQLRQAQLKHAPREVDALLLDSYSDVVH